MIRNRGERAEIVRAADQSLVGYERLHYRGSTVGEKPEISVPPGHEVEISIWFDVATGTYPSEVILRAKAGTPGATYTILKGFRPTA